MTKKERKALKKQEKKVTAVKKEDAAASDRPRLAPTEQAAPTK